MEQEEKNIVKNEKDEAGSRQKAERYAAPRRSRQGIRKQRQIQLRVRLAKIFVVVLGVVILINFIKKDQSFSESENRMLSERPQLTWESLKSGKYMTEFESYVSDQFFMRNQWITLKLYEDKLMGKKESNGVYLGKKGYLIEKLEKPDWENIEKNVKSIAALGERHADIPVYMGLVPNAAYILDDKMPYGAPTRDQDADIAQILKYGDGKIRNIDISSVMKEHAGEEIYYKTDHHWTSLGAYYAFGRIAEEMKLENVASDYNVYTVATDFQGTLASKSGYHGSRDTVQVYEPKDQNTDCVVLYTEEGKKATSIYDSKCLEQKDKYTVFFGGNHARIDISTTQKERKNLLLFKDSYANCMVQFLLPYYQNIIVIDPRYFYDSIDNIIESYAITDILFLYNVNTFVTDNSIADVLTAG